MKTPSIVIYILFSLLMLPTQLPASSTMGGVETTEIKVKGVCGMCEKRIENAALIKGVKMADWDKETDVLKVVYNPDKVTVDQIQKAVVETGHSTEKYKANAEVYNQLPKCCQYEDGVHKH